MVKIVDAHMHCWELGKINYSWLTPDAGILFNNYSPADLEGERTTIGIDGAILVQSDNSLEDSSFMFEQAMKYPWIKGVVAWLPLDNTAATERILVDQYLHQPTFKGIRHLMHLEADEWLLQDEVVDSLRVLADHQIAFDAIGINRNQFRTIIEVGRRIPTLRMVIDHLNQPPLVDAGGFKEWKELMREASALPEMHAKISGLGTVKRSVQATLTEAIRPAVATALETFGENRCFCGGDWPISLLDNSYVNTWTAYQKVLHEVMGEGTSIHKILYDNTLRFYRREA